MRVSPETIYQSLYVQARGGLKRELTAFLRTGRSMRKPRRREAERRGRIPNMVMISERPPEIEDRAVPGHWEGDLGLDIYFCDPHSPWQRGSNENTNGLLRQYLPKSTDLSFYGPGLLDAFAAELNARPRKRHGFHTPAKVLDQLLSKATSDHGVA